MNFNPLGDRLLIQATKPPEFTPGGLTIPESAREDLRRGTIVAVGPGRVLDSGDRLGPQVREGQSVVFVKYAGTEIILDNEKFIVVREDEVLGILSGG